MAAGVSEYIERVETDGGEVESDIYVSESVLDLGDFFDDASLVNIPTAYKATKLYSIKPTDGSGDFTFSRSTTGTRINESGLIESVGVNVPRIDYSGASPSLLLEPQRSNLFEYSEYYETSDWTKSNIGLITNDSVSPEGVNNATLIYPAATSSGLAYMYNPTSGSLGRYTISAFVKADGLNVCWLYISSVSAQGLVYFDLSDESIQVVAGSSSTPIGTITEISNGWYRVTCTLGADLAISSGMGIGVADAKGSTSVTKSGEDGILVYGLQIEEGTYATSYIPTSGTTVTRTIDAITNSVSYALSSGYTIFIELQTQSLTDSNDIEFKDASSNYVFRVGDEVIVGAGLFTQANTTGYNKFALQVDASGNYELFKNGSSVTSGSGIAHDIEVISSVAGQDVRQMIIFEQALTDAECITLTT